MIPDRFVSVLGHRLRVQPEPIQGRTTFDSMIDLTEPEHIEA